jgi:hypothetical protein
MNNLDSLFDHALNELTEVDDHNDNMHHDLNNENHCIEFQMQPL